MRRRPVIITRSPDYTGERLRRAIDDIREYINNTPRFDVFAQSTTIVQSAAGGGDTTLFTTTIPADSLAEAGDSVQFEASVVYASNANNKRMRVKLGSSTIFDSSSLAINGGSTLVTGKILRIAAASQRYHLAISSTNTSLLGLSSAGGITENLATDLTLSVIGNGTTLGDVSGWMFHVGFIPRP